MPDPTRKTISATQAPALFNASPYITRWMLFHHLASGLDIDATEDSRMSWGKKLQPLIIEQASADLRLEVHPNAGDDYVSRGLLGCTRDATIIDPERGPGALETKCVFDYGVWMRDWNEGRQPPRHHEIQLQQQMCVGDGEHSFRWGIIAAWVCGDVYYFQRSPIDQLWIELGNEARKLFVDIRAGQEPDPFGTPIELPLLRELFPVIKGDVLDLTDHPDAAKITETFVQLDLATQQKAAAEVTDTALRAAAFAIAKHHDEILLPDGMRVTIRKAGAHGKRFRLYRPLQKGGIAADHFMGG